MGKYTLDMKKYAALGRAVSAESSVLLKNDAQALPVKSGETVSVFGRIQFNYYKSGTGSGGMVNTKYVTGILDALKACEDITIDGELLDIYEKWVTEQPFDQGKGWGQEPWSQQEMPLTDEIVEAAAKRSDIAIVIIGRTAGEDQDNKAEKGSYLLSDLEEEMLQKVCRHFKRTAVVLNVGNILDMKWVDKYDPQAVLYVWQGGMEGGNGAVDVLTGRINPSGKLPDTIAGDISDYPSTGNFGDADEVFYAEDIYVGYRYFETFAKDRVLYPFGFGLSYTEFAAGITSFEVGEEKVSLSVEVTNRGGTAGKEVIQIFVSAPQGKLGKPVRSLAAFEKTKLLQPGERELLSFTLLKKDMASYDDGGCTGYKSCYVLEAGKYVIYAGSDVRSAGPAGSFEIDETVVTERLQEALAPVKPFKRLKAVGTADGIDTGSEIARAEEAVPLRTINLTERIKINRPDGVPYKGDRGIRLESVYDRKAAMDDFLSQLSDEDLACMVRGEGMCSPKVTPGTAAAFGGVTESLRKFGIPVGCCADGPSGIRMDCGTHAFSLPNGTAAAATFNTGLIEELFEMLGLELRKNQIDTLLGPGMNIHRNPLNGRNFEYFSEDPLLTGKMAAAQLRGMHRHGATGTIKHFAANNQEFRRSFIDSVISERALREIYLKGFKIAVDEGQAFLVMSTYGSLNGLWTAGNYDLLTTVLRQEWGFDGLVMTDWWAKINDEGGDGRLDNTAAMIRGQNDVYMVVSDSLTNSGRDNTLEGLERSMVTRGELQRAAGNICRALMKLPVMDRYLGRLSEEETADIWQTEPEEKSTSGLSCIPVGDQLVIDVSNVNTDRGSDAMFGLELTEHCIYTLNFKIRAISSELAQLPMSIFINQHLIKIVTINGSANGEWIDSSLEIGPYRSKCAYLRLFFGQSGMELGELKITCKRE
ncbi:glycoside hydrolase family 3 protein [Ruminiclostridium cellobioparum]|uniref:Glycoside hydrolase family protein n=1 Tax=Ruminiclostridium cellobioparum subsp. termitidis CT1112 TaxID=1195236 RepID=S0FWF6_RUMCE|nr:glycoside hydrolase family 3 protein [Ruminiclostridium cellobioparum]EMS72868.1 glycoside hydrolase family protein [Ruminiclostridium cellobioparum subsp. termitidis CT1112]